MIQMVRDILDLFRKEKLYLFLLIGIILFFLLFTLFQRKYRANEPLDPRKQKIEAILKEAPQNAQQIEKKLVGRPGLRLVIQFFTVLFLSAFAYGVWLGTIDLRKIFSREELIPKINRKLHITWGIQEIVKFLLIFISAGIAMNLVAVFFKLVLSVPIETSDYLLIHTIVIDLAAVWIMIMFVKKSGAGTYDLSGFWFSQFPKEELWWGVRTYFLILPIFIMFLIGLVIFASMISYEPPTHPLIEVLLEEEKLSPWTIFASFLIACVIGPMVEETFFRGFFYPAVRKYLGVGWTAVITSMIFAGVHENLFSFIPIFFLGLVLCYLYEKRSSLISCVTLHIIHNTAFIVYFFLMKSVLFSGQG